MTSSQSTTARTDDHFYLRLFSSHHHIPNFILEVWSASLHFFPSLINFHIQLTHSVFFGKTETRTVVLRATSLQQNEGHWDSSGSETVLAIRYQKISCPLVIFKLLWFKKLPGLCTNNKVLISHKAGKVLHCNQKGERRELAYPVSWICRGENIYLPYSVWGGKQNKLQLSPYHGILYLSEHRYINPKWPTLFQLTLQLLLDLQHWNPLKIRAFWFYTESECEWKTTLWIQLSEYYLNKIWCRQYISRESHRPLLHYTPTLKKTISVKTKDACFGFTKKAGDTHLDTDLHTTLVTTSQNLPFKASAETGAHCKPGMKSKISTQSKNISAN